MASTSEELAAQAQILMERVKFFSIDKETEDYIELLEEMPNKDK